MSIRRQTRCSKATFRLKASANRRDIILDLGAPTLSRTLYGYKLDGSWALLLRYESLKNLCQSLASSAPNITKEIQAEIKSLANAVGFKQGTSLEIFGYNSSGFYVKENNCPFAHFVCVENGRMLDFFRNSERILPDVPDSKILEVIVP